MHINLENQILEFCEQKWKEKTLEKLANKLSEECGEICGAVVKIPEMRATPEDLKNEIGDLLIVVAQFAAKLNTTIDELVIERFKQIKLR